MDFHEFPTIYSVLKQNGLVQEETPDRFYAGSLALLRVKARQFPSHALAVEHNCQVTEPLPPVDAGLSRSRVSSGRRQRRSPPSVAEKCT